MWIYFRISLDVISLASLVLAMCAFIDVFVTRLVVERISRRTIVRVWLCLVVGFGVGAIAPSVELFMKQKFFMAWMNPSIKNILFSVYPVCFAVSVLILFVVIQTRDVSWQQT